MCLVKVTVIVIHSEIGWCCEKGVHRNTKDQVLYKRAGRVIIRVNFWIWVCLIQALLHNLQTQWKLQTWAGHGQWKTFLSKRCWERKMERKAFKRNTETRKHSFFLLPSCLQWYNSENSKTNFKALPYTSMVLIWFAHRMFFCSQHFQFSCIILAKPEILFGIQLFNNSWNNAFARICNQWKTFYPVSADLMITCRCYNFFTCRLCYLLSSHHVQG